MTTAAATSRKPTTYKIVGGGVDSDGWYKVHLLRDDGRSVKVRKQRVKELRRQGRITE